MSVSYDFSGYQILVTGAGKGIGRDLCIALYKAKASKIFALTRTESDLKSLVNETSGDVVVPIVLDLNSSVERMEEVLTPVFRNNDINYLVNNAGTGVLESFTSLTEAAFDKVTNINYKSLVFVSKIFAQSYLSRKEQHSDLKSGAIVNVSSQASKTPLIDHTVYCASKAAVDHVSRCMALELGKHGMRVNTVNPTVVLTALGKSAWSDEEKAGPMRAKIPLGRFAEVDDVVQPILFLLSDASKMVHGIQMEIDGGFCNCN